MLLCHLRKMPLVNLATKKAAATCLFFVAAVVHAQTATVDTEHVHSDQHVTALSETDHARSDAWNLTDVEWKRYLLLMDGIRRHVSDRGITPIEVLGIHARDSEERRKYARIWARIMVEDAVRILAFQREYDKAIAQLLRGQSLVNQRQLRKREPDEVLRKGDRVLFFMGLDCDVCDSVWHRLIGKLNNVAGIDIYVVSDNQHDDASIQDWARKQRVEPSWVRDQRVTLNSERGMLESLGFPRTELPLLMRLRSGRIEPLTGSVLQ